MASSEPDTGFLTGSVLLVLLPRKPYTTRKSKSRARRNRSAAEELPGTARLLGKASRPPRKSTVPFLPPVTPTGSQHSSPSPTRTSRLTRSQVSPTKAPGFGPELPASERQQVSPLASAHYGRARRPPARPFPLTGAVSFWRKRRPIIHDGARPPPASHPPPLTLHRRATCTSRCCTPLAKAPR